ncbi:uncharacterized protein LOC131663392 [Phymastichus coffea]|uniref:uncharacterized protein LOC131663392 n=1 Tax=Phymastichus coffea TaxID=108790 RepID=UPI00273B1613|nr:uncharacterized protein LOC131663392 [Phymastichus coffea]
MLDPEANTLKVKGCDEPIPAALSSMRAEELISLASLGIKEITESQRREIDELMHSLLPDPPCEQLGCTSWIKHDIDLKCAHPIKQRYYPVSKKIEDEMHEQVQKMLRMGIIRKSKSEWSSPIVMTPKQDGTYRFCIDYRKVNAQTRVPAYPLPYMDVILRKIQHAKFISALDCSGAFWQIPLTERSIPITAFTVPGLGLFEFVRMPYGLSGGPATLQMLADKIITPEMEPYAFAYLDDLLIATETFSEHIKWLTCIVKRLNEAGLTINRKKSKICMIEVRDLGLLVNRDGCRPDPERVRPILEYPAPRNLKQLRRFLGMASWYRKFLEGYASLSEPLTALTRKDCKYTWTAKQEAAFEQVKALLASAPVLARPDFSAPFIVECDASDTGLGSVLLQHVEGADHHYSLVWLRNLRSPNGKLGRWSLRLQAYDFDIVHRSGKDNVVPDALSRMYETNEDAIAATASLSVGEGTKDPWYRNKIKKVLADPRAHPYWKVKVEQVAPAGLMGKHVVSRPWEIVCGDSMGPFPKSPQGHEYLLIFMDMFTRWIECIPIRKANGKTIKRELNQRVFLRFGVPEKFLSDNGTPFKNKLVDVYHATCAPYSPKSNPTERVNWTVKTMMAAFIQEKHTKWDEHIAEFAFAYNTAIHKAIRSSPAFLNYGRNPEPPHTARREETLEATRRQEAAALGSWQAKMGNLGKLHVHASESSQAAQARQEKYYNKGHRDVRYDVGDKVWAKNRVLSSAARAIAAKLCPKYAGPFVVTARLGPNSYQLQIESGVDVGKVAVCDLKPCHDAEQFPEKSGCEDQLASDGEQEMAPDSDEPKFSGDQAPACETLPQPLHSQDATKLELTQKGRPPRKRGRPPGSKKSAPPPNSTRMLPARTDRTVRLDVPVEELRRMQQLIGQILEAHASSVPPSPSGAAKEEKQAYWEVLAFADHPDARARALVPQEFLQRVKRATKLRDYLDAAEAPFVANEEVDKTRADLMALQRQKLQELEAL